MYAGPEPAKTHCIEPQHLQQVAFILEPAVHLCLQRQTQKLDSTASIPLQQQRHLSTLATDQTGNAAVSFPAVCALFGCLGRLLELQSKRSSGSSTAQANHAGDSHLPGRTQHVDSLAAGVSGNKAGNSSDAIQNDAMSDGNGSEDGSKNSSSSGNKAGDSSDALESDAMSDGGGSDDGSRNSSSSGKKAGGSSDAIESDAMSDGSGSDDGSRSSNDAEIDRQEMGVEAVQQVALQDKKQQPQAADPGVADCGRDAVLGRAFEGHVRDLRMILSKPWRLSTDNSGGASGR